MRKLHSKAPEDVATESASISSRRNVITCGVTGIAGAVGLALAGTHAFATPLDGPGCLTPIADILTIARTAERLAVTFYTNGIAHADDLGIYGNDLEYLRAALVEEQIHELFFAANGGGILTSVFSFPHGPHTFNDLHTFIATQQQL